MKKWQKLTGYQSVAVVELGSGYSKKDYYFAIYEDGTKYAVGDTVYVSGNGSDRIVTIKDFVTPVLLRRIFLKVLLQKLFARLIQQHTNIELCSVKKQQNSAKRWIKLLKKWMKQRNTKCMQQRIRHLESYLRDTTNWRINNIRF